MSQKNYYIILEVSRNATTHEIKASYRQLAKKYHPDRNIGNKASEEYFKEIQEAYFILSNPEKKKKYDSGFFYNNASTQTRKTTTSTPYNGNAYQYAQRQAQQKKREKSTDKEEKNDIPQETNEVNQIFMSIGIALILLYFIISYSAKN